MCSFMSSHVSCQSCREISYYTPLCDYEGFYLPLLINSKCLCPCLTHSFQILRMCMSDMKGDTPQHTAVCFMASCPHIAHIDMLGAAKHGLLYPVMSSLLRCRSARLPLHRHSSDHFFMNSREKA